MFCTSGFVFQVLGAKLAHEAIERDDVSGLSVSSVFSLNHRMNFSLTVT